MQRQPKDNKKEHWQTRDKLMLTTRDLIILTRLSHNILYGVDMIDYLLD